MEKAVYRNVSLTPDGKIMTFSSNKNGAMDVILRDLTSGEERTITSEAPEKTKSYAVINAKGTDVVYTMFDASDSQPVYVVSAHGGAKRMICSECGPTLSLSPDGGQILASRFERAQSHINLIDIASGKSTLLLQHVKYALGAARFSPDGKWISFLVSRGAASVDAVLAPFRGPTIVPEQDWITITAAPANVLQVLWSPDGGLLYYVQNAGNSSSLMARHLDRNHHPAGAPFRVYEFTGRARPTSFARSGMLSAVPGRFIGVLAENNFNIWMMDMPK
jgi:Tol biopolymer transport system component